MIGCSLGCSGAATQEDRCWEVESAMRANEYGALNTLPCHFQSEGWGSNDDAEELMGDGPLPLPEFT